MSDAAAHGLTLRARADTLASGFPSLLASAENLASLAVLGPHGRRRPGLGAEFWQYRPAEHTDGLRDIDWRRSARSDDRYVRQMELQVAQSLSIWVDQAASMDFSSSPQRDTKATRAEVLALAAALLMVNAGERVGLINDGLTPKIGLPQVEKMAMSLASAKPQSIPTPSAPSRSQSAAQAAPFGPTQSRRVAQPMRGPTVTG